MSLPEDFSSEHYLYLHPDVRMAGMDPAQHYLTWGLKEGRSYKRDPDSLLPKVEGTFNSDGLTSVHNHDFMSDPRYIAAYARGVEAVGSDYKWFWRVHIGLWAARTAARHVGDFVECGVNYGFLSSAIMKDLDWNNTDRMFYLLDTYSGIDERFLSDQEKTEAFSTKASSWSKVAHTPPTWSRCAQTSRNGPVRRSFKARFPKPLIRSTLLTSLTCTLI